MPHLLLIGDESAQFEPLERLMLDAGHVVARISSGAEALDVLASRPIDLVIFASRLADMTAVEFLRIAPARTISAPHLIVAADRAATDALQVIRLGAAGLIESPIDEHAAFQLINRILHLREATRALIERRNIQRLEPHAATRWAAAVVRIVDCPRDVRTVAQWARWIAASSGALRNWCWTVGIGPRRSLIFGRMLRAVIVSQRGRCRLENLLDVADRRTLFGLLRLTGLNDVRDIPRNADEFLRRQVLVRDSDALSQVRRVLHERRRRDLAGRSA